MLLNWIELLICLINFCLIMFRIFVFVEKLVVNVFINCWWLKNFLVGDWVLVMLLV